MYDNALFRFNGATCEKDFIGYTPYTMFDIAVTPSGRLFGTTSEALYEIDTTNANFYFIADIFPPGFGVNNLISLNDDYLLTVSMGGLVQKIKVSDGSVIPLGTNAMLSGSAGDLTYFKGYYYLCRADNLLVRFQIDSDETTLLAVDIVGTLNTEYSSVWGIITVGESNCDKDNLKMLAFEGYTVYNVNPYTAECEIICDSIYYINATGAASFSEVYAQVSVPKIIMPNVFTPNQDGYNDTYHICTYNDVKDLEISIINRWGEKVFHGTEVSFQWDGRNQQQSKVSEGTYYYILQYTDSCDNEYSKDGFITVIK